MAKESRGIPRWKYLWKFPGGLTTKVVICEVHREVCRHQSDGIHAGDERLYAATKAMEF